MGLDGVESLAMSPDGAHVYAAGSQADALAAFSRNPSTGALTFIEVHVDGIDGVDGLDRVRAVTVSPDGAHVYAAGYEDNAVVMFSRDAATGMLTFGQVLLNGMGGITSLHGAHGVTVSPDGKNVYVAGNRADSVTVFSRNATTGMLELVEAQVLGVGGITSLDGAETIAVSPDGAHVYVAAEDDNTVTVFSRDAETGALTLVEVKQQGVGGITGLSKVQGVTVSPDGANVYTAAGESNAVVVFNRDAATGMLTFVEKQKDGQGGVTGLSGAEWVTVSPNGAFVYAVADLDKALTVFSRDAATGKLTFVEKHKDGVGGVDGIQDAESVVVSPEGAHLYVAGDTDDAIGAFGNLCGNGTLGAGEQCDDGNLVDGDCCSSVCSFEVAGGSCGDDGNICTDDQCDGAGACLHINNSDPCDDGAFCTVGDTCQGGVCQGAARDCSAAGDQCIDNHDIARRYHQSGGGGSGRDGDVEIFIVTFSVHLRNHKTAYSRNRGDRRTGKSTEQHTG